MNRIIVKLYVPLIEKQYDVWIPINKNIYQTIQSFIKGINSLNQIEYDTTKFPKLYKKSTAEPYDLNAVIIDTDIRNGSELILL